MELWKGQSCWKKGCLVYCILAIPGLLIFYGAYRIMSGHSDERVRKDATETEASAPFGLDDDDRQPLLDTEYINLSSGDKWGFVQATSDDGSEAKTVAYFMGNGMQGRDFYTMQPTDNSCFTLSQAGSDADCGITVYVYPGADSIRVTRDGRIAIFKTAASFDEAVSSVDPDYTPARYAINAGDHGGKWEVLQSGETVYEFPSGEYARSQWVKDGDKLYYVDVSGCKMLNNWAHDGFYAGSDGSWDRSVRVINDNVLPRNGAAYRDDFGKTWTFQMTSKTDGTIEGRAHMAYPESIGHEADYTVKSFGSSAYRLYNVKDEFDCWHLVVLDGGRTLRVSGAGVTEVFELQK